MKKEITDITPLKSTPGHVMTLIIACVVGLAGFIILLCYLIPLAIKYPNEVTVSFIILCFIVAGFGLFTKPYPCKHGDGHTVCGNCEKENK